MNRDNDRLAYIRLPENNLQEFPSSNENLTVGQPTDHDETYVTGAYEYESDALFGTPTTSEGPYIYHRPTRLFGIVTPPSTFEMVRGTFNQLDELGNGTSLPPIDAEDTHELYRDHGTGIHKVQFKPSLNGYERGSRKGQEYDPEAAAEQAATETRDLAATEDEIRKRIDAAIEENQYVTTARLDLDGMSLTYEAPLCFHAPRTTVQDRIAITELVIEYFLQ